MLGAARTAWDARAWAPTGPDPQARRTTAAATLSTFTFTGLNGANYTTSLSQFGAGSLDLVSAGNNRIIQQTGWSGPFPSGTGDFCIEGWVYKPAARGTVTTGDPICNNQTGGLCIRFGQGYNSGGFNYLSLFARGQADLDYAAFTWPDDTWCHWAVQRKSGTMSFRANGNKLTISGGSGGGARNFAAASSTTLSIGSYNNGGSTDETMRSYMDEMCVSNSWRYDDAYSTYTIPTAAFTVDTITDMLIHFDSSLTTAAT
jgi:hypothetical protein